MKLRTLLLGLSALFIASAAAYFSVTGLSKLFAGASTAVILMASSLEFGKLISASFLYVYWEKINKALRAYLLVGVCVLIIITSAGIYGFLTSAYQSTADQLNVLDKQTQVYVLKKNRFQDQLDSYTKERSTLNQSISELSKGISNNVIQYKDAKGDMITTTSSGNRKTLEKQLDDSKKQRDVISDKIETLSDSISKLDLKVITVNSSNELAAEVGPLKFMAEITGQPMATIVNWFALLIIFVFDPLAVTLVIAFNTAMQIDKSEEIKSTPPTVLSPPLRVYGDLPDTLPVLSHPVETETPSDPPSADLTEKLDKLDSIVNEAVDEIDESAPSQTIADEPIANAPITPTEEDIRKWEEFMKNWYETKDKVEPVSETTPIVEETPKIDPELAALQPQYGINPVSIDNNGQVDGWDTNDDGLIDKFSYQGTIAGKRDNPLPYYARPGFDWNDKGKWINDKSAVNYWITNRKF